MKAKPYWNPYIAGVVLGLTLLATFLIAGQGLGASAFPKRTLALVGQRDSTRVDRQQHGARRIPGRRRTTR